MSDDRTVTLPVRDLVFAAFALDDWADSLAETAKADARFGDIEASTRMTRHCLAHRGMAARIRRALEASRGGGDGRG